MSAANYPITGPPLPSVAPTNGSVPLRLEVRDLQQNYPDQWNLYLLGLQAFYQLDETSDLSYYGIAGIHGRPYREWGNVSGTNNSRWQGYCTHTSILFAPWHRPYLALFEQVLYGIIQNIANSFPDATLARYQQAASTFRIPYWDWAAQPPSGDQYFPVSVGGSTTATVITPQSNGQTVTIPNPLYSYKFSPLDPEQGDFINDQGVPYNKWPTTLRYPSSSRSVNATSQEDQVFDAMSSQFAGLQSSVNILMNDPNYKDFAAFSNHVWQVNEPGTYASLEDIHNSIHGEVGGNVGHMAELDYSAFDPVFWLHHANVDRLFAIWQALNPTSYTINQPAGDGTFVITASSIETDTTPLAPFNDATGQAYWNSDRVRSTETFNYAYPETQRWAFSSDSDYMNSVQNAVNQLYGAVPSQFAGDQGFGDNFMAIPASIPAGPVTKEKAGGSSAHEATSGSAQKPIAAPAPEAHKSGFHPFHDILDKAKHAFSGGSESGGDGTRGLDLEAEIGKDSGPTQPAKPVKFTEYICNIKAPKHILHQTYRVHIFLGPFDGATETWHTQDALVGTFAVFGKDPATTACGKCKTDAEAHVVITGTVPLTAQLLTEYKKGNLGGMDKENVLPYLKDNLHWRVTLADGTDKRREEVPGLSVSVVTTEVEIEGGRQRFSGVYEVHPEVTEGRPAGHNAGDQV